MIFWLDWKLFGNGWGMASPQFDDVFYWLDGRFYRWIGGFGAQLESIEWSMPKPGTERHLFGHSFVVFQADRRWLRVRVSWSVVPYCGTAEEIRALKDELQQWGHGLQIGQYRDHA